ncbi:MAG: WecB/TagA/CpsF family glycosyltransferase [Candidatus Melainabacteria bacterium]
MVAHQSDDRTAHLMGYRVDCVDCAQALAMVSQKVSAGKNAHVVTLNPEMLMQGDQNPELGRILRRADLCIPDGAGLVWALRRQGATVQRLPGIEFSEALLAESARQGWKVAIIGAQPAVLNAAVDAVQTRYPGMNLVYSHHGFFASDADQDEIARTCAGRDPTVVLVALGVPRQEQWIDRYAPLFRGTVFVGVGGSLDVWSGQTQRAPAWMRALNLEWLYRITSEPWRIQRVMKTLPQFVWRVLSQPL